MNTSDHVRLNADSAVDIADGVTRLSDFRKQYVNLGIAGVHAVAALALSLDRFAAAIEPKEDSR